MPRDKPPNGKEISEKAKKAKLDHGKEGVGEKNGKKSKLVPAHLDHLKDRKELEDGQFIGVLDTEVPGDDAGLPPGKSTCSSPRWATTGRSISSPAARSSRSGQGDRARGHPRGDGAPVQRGQLLLVGLADLHRLPVVRLAE